MKIDFYREDSLENYIQLYSKHYEGNVFISFAINVWEDSQHLKQTFFTNLSINNATYEGNWKLLGWYNIPLIDQLKHFQFCVLSFFLES